MRTLLLMMFSIVILNAQTIEQLIQTAINKHPSLKTIEHRLSAMDEKISLSQNFSNPDVSLTVNDIQFSDPSNRSLEPMQFQSVNFKQKFPWFGKLDARKKYTEAQKSVIFNSYKSAKIALAQEIRVTVYTIKELELRIKIVEEYIGVSKQNIALYTSYASTESQSHTNSMNASLLLSKVKIKAANYKSLLKSQKAKLTYLVSKKVKHISSSLHVHKPKSLSYYLSKYANNPNYTMRLSQNDVARTNRDMLALDTTPDPFVQVGYFNRSNYNDYASINIGASIPLYGSEELKTEAARKEMLATASASLDYKYALKSEIKTLYARLVEAYSIYKILNNETLPQLEHMFELTQASIQEGGNLFEYTNLLEQKLNVEEDNVAIKAEFFRIKAKLKSLIGEV